MELITERGEIKVYDDFTWSLNFIAAEVVNLTGRKASYTKTINVPYTGANRLIFEGLNELNVHNVGFDTKRSLSAFISHNGRVLLKGTLIVLEYDQLKEQQIIQLQLVATMKRSVSKLKGLALQDLDFSRFNHLYEQGHIFNNITYGTIYLDGVQQSMGDGRGYAYGLIDYGKDDTAGETQWKVTDLRPCLYLKEYIDTMFRFVGLTYTSLFLDSPYFLSIVLENTISEVSLTDNQKSEFGTEIENTTTFSTYTDNGDFPTTGAGFPPPAQNVLIADWAYNLEFNNEVTDPLNQWNISGTNVFTAPRKGTFSFDLFQKFTHEFAVDPNHPSLSVLYNALSTGQVFDITIPQVIEDHYVQILKNGILFDEISYQAMPPSIYPLEKKATTVYPIDWIQGSQVTNSEKFTIDLLENETITFRVFEVRRTDAIPQAYEPLIHRFNYTELNIKTTLENSLVEENDEINFLNYIPDIDATAFINGVFNTFNLWVFDDPNDENNLIIEPRTNVFDGNGFLRMSKKVDRTKNLNSNFLSDTLPKTYEYKFAVSPDTLNEAHNSNNKIGYSDYISKVDVDFTNDSRTIETIFSPIITQRKNSLYYPLEFQSDGSTKTGIGSFLKMGFASKQNGSWEFSGDLGVLDMTEYIQISEFDDVINPNYALTFGDALTSINQNSIPYWNLYRLFHKLTEDEQTRKGSKVVTLYFNLNENDISQLDLRRAWEVDGVYYRIVSINSFNPITNESTKVSLLQIENPKFDYTSNEMIYNLKGIVNVLGANGQQIITTNLNQYVQPN